MSGLEGCKNHQHHISSANHIPPAYDLQKPPTHKAKGIQRSHVLPIPNLHQTITSPRHEPPPNRHIRILPHHPPRRQRRRPAHSIAPTPMRLEDLVAPIPLLELQHGDPTVRGRAREQAAGFVGGPAHDVDGGRVQGEVGHAGPLGGSAATTLLRGGRGGGGFAPDEDFAVIGGGGEDGAVFGVGLLSFCQANVLLGGCVRVDKGREYECEGGINWGSEADPRDAPDCSLMPIVLPRSQRISPPTSSREIKQAGRHRQWFLPSQRFRELVLVPLDFEDLDRLVG